jgi:transposase
LFYQQLDGLQGLRQEARRALLAESRKHGATELLRRIPYIGPIRAALLIALLQTPHRFRTKRQLWAYSGLALETHSSGEYHYVQGQLQRSKKPLALCAKINETPSRLEFTVEGGEGNPHEEEVEWRCAGPTRFGFAWCGAE